MRRRGHRPARWWLPLMLAMPLAAGCGALVVGGAAAGGYYLGKDDRTLEEISQDAAITTRINALYVRDGYVSAMDIDVDTRRGVVTLHGVVPNAAAAQRAVRLAGGVAGVRKVVSRLQVVPD